jgi:hypothetical protein
MWRWGGNIKISFKTIEPGDPPVFIYVYKNTSEIRMNLSITNEHFDTYWGVLASRL